MGGEQPPQVERMLDDFVAAARETLGSDLVSVVLYGSAAEGRLRPTSDVNVLVVLERFELEKIDALREPARLAKALVRLEPMWVLESEIDAALTAFAVKFGDIMHRNRVLFGSDPFAGRSVPRTASIHRLRQVLLNLSLRLRDAYVERSLREEQLAHVLADFSGPLRTLTAALLELEGAAPSSPKAALESLATELGDPRFQELVRAVSEARETGRLHAGVALPVFQALFELVAVLRARAEALT
jgi:predicted nucleotidyltransferase